MGQNHRHRAGTVRRGGRVQIGESHDDHGMVEDGS
jgi:hypothetical protein